MAIFKHIIKLIKVFGLLNNKYNQYLLIRAVAPRDLASDIVQLASSLHIPDI